MTIALKHSDIISGRGYMKDVNTIVNNFISTQRKNGIVITDEHKRELNKVTKVLVAKHKNSKPVVIHSWLGFGKSTLLLEYIKYMCNIDDEFSALVVNRTIKECKEFAIGLGKKKEHKRNLAFGKGKDIREIYDYNEEKFIALAFRGFNYNECMKDFIGNTEGLSEFNENIQAYYPSICNECYYLNCPIHNLMFNAQNHRIVVATHMRIFLSYDNKDILKSLTYWKDSEGNKHKRQFVFVDEKLDTVDIDNFRFDDWSNLSETILKSPKIDIEIKEKINEINKYLVNLPYPIDCKDIIKIEPYDINFAFDKSLYGLFSENIIMIETLSKVEKALRNEGTVSRDWRDNTKIISYFNYLNIDKYFQDEFSKCIILDATAKYDKDYSKSDVIYVNDLKVIKKGNINVYKTSGITSSKSKLYYNGDKENSYNDNLKYYAKNVEYIAKDIYDVINTTNFETLVVCYKDFADKAKHVYNFKKDLINELTSLDIKTKYHVVHFGQYTTGVNDFKDCKNIIIIGQLDKGQLYYENKAFCLNDSSDAIKLNEYTIDMIQQIGRTSVRNDSDVNVYMLGKNDELVEHLCKYFNANIYDWVTKFYNAFNLDRNKDKPRYYAFEYLISNLIEVGDFVQKKEIKEYLINEHNVNSNTAAKVFQDEHLTNQLSLNGIADNPNNIQQFIKLQ